jgi:hypothetical protein
MFISDIVDILTRHMDIWNLLMKWLRWISMELDTFMQERHTSIWDKINSIHHLMERFKDLC